MYPVSEAFLQAVPGGAGEHPEVLLDGEDNNCGRSRVSF